MVSRTTLFPLTTAIGCTLALLNSTPMHTLPRRPFLQFAVSAIPSVDLPAQSADSGLTAKPALVAAGSDREGKKHVIGVSATTYKVLTADTGGAMFVMEQANQKHGGPTRHFHYSQDELFYVIEGQYIVEVGAERFHLKAGDCVLGPRRIPHAWAFVGESTGRLLLTYAPAGRMEEFFNHREQLGIKSGEYATSTSAETMRQYGMEPVGPPLKLD